MKKKKKDGLKSRYAGLDFENMSDEEFNRVSRKVYMSIVLRGFGAICLFIVCIVALVLCSRYIW